MYNRETDYRNKHKKYKNSVELKLIKNAMKNPSNYRDRINKISKGCKYSFKKSNKVTIKQICMFIAITNAALQ